MEPIRHLRIASIGAVVAAAFAVSCSEATVDDASGGSVSTGSTVASASGTGATGTGSSTAGATGSTSSGGPGGVVINEMSGAGDDYIELFNAGSAMVDLSNIRVADQDTPGVPKLADAVTLPQGTSLPPGAYLFILGGVKNPMPGPQTDCAPGPAPCFDAGFKLSNSNGDAVFLVATDDSVLEAETYPANVADGQTWSRLPNGTGPFASGAATPGAANAAP